MAILLFDENMDVRLRAEAISLAMPHKSWKVNSNITAHKFDLEGFEDNEVVLAQYFETIKQKIQFRKTNKSLLVYK